MSKEKELELCLLLDFYGDLLSEPKRRSAELYYNDDLSLAEIAELCGITRQGVRDNIEKAREQLRFYEERLGLAAKLREIDRKLADITAGLEKLRAASSEPVKAELELIINEVKTITI